MDEIIKKGGCGFYKRGSEIIRGFFEVSLDISV
jgi:hypothetical protein